MQITQLLRERVRQVRFFDRAHNSCPTAEGIQSRITELTLDSFDSSDELLIGRIAAIGHVARRVT